MQEDYTGIKTIVTGSRDSSVTLVAALLLLTLAAGVVGAIAGASIGFVLDSPHLLKFAAGGLAAGLLLAFVYAFKRLFYFVEIALGVDLNGDGFQGEPEPEPEPRSVHEMRVILEEDQGRHIEFIDLPHADRLPVLAAGLLAGRSFNQAAWTGAGGLFSRAEFDQLRDVLIERGLAAWKNPNSRAQGVELTAAWRAVMRRLAERSPALSGGNDE